MSSFFERELTSLIDLSEERIAPLYADFSPSERERIFQAWVTHMPAREVLELQETDEDLFKVCMAAWKKLILTGGDPRDFTIAYQTLLSRTNFPLLDEAIEQVWEKYQGPVMSFMHREQAS